MALECKRNLPAVFHPDASPGGSAQTGPIPEIEIVVTGRCRRHAIPECSPDMDGSEIRRQVQVCIDRVRVTTGCANAAKQQFRPVRSEGIPAEPFITNVGRRGVAQAGARIHAFRTIVTDQ